MRTGVLTAGTAIAGYRIERILGSGGMGSVYVAAHPTLPRRDALKVLSAELSRDVDFRARFIREADLAASLEHPQIVSVYNRGQTDDGQLWIAMQFVDGTDADAALRAGTMTPPRAVHIVSEVAKALDFAHAHNVVHRDVKPANFLLSGPAGLEERALLGDFGIARALDDVGLTATGSVMATVAYAAPEALSGMAIDGRADIYSLGCTLFRLLTGKTPFAATNGPAAVMMAHLQAPPPRVTDLVESLPPAMNAVIATAMAKDPAARFGSAGGLAAAAAVALRDPTLRIGPSVAPVPSREVSSYQRMHASAPTTPGWRHNGWASGLSVPRQRHRRRGLLIGGVAGSAALIAAAITAVLVWPGGEPAPAVSARDTAAPASEAQGPIPDEGPPATDVPVSALPSILLTGSEIPGNTGDNAVVLEQDGTNLLDDAATIDDQACLGAWAPVQQTAYAKRGPTGVVVQELRALYQKAWQDSITQAAVAFASVDDAGFSLTWQRLGWDNCAGKTVTITPPGEPAQTWQFDQPVNKAGAYTIEAKPDGGGATCQHGIEIRGNVLIDIRRCGPAGTADVSALVNATANRVPRQR